MAGPALAANGTWNVNASGEWTNALNWVSYQIADGENNTATFGNVITANRTVTLNGNRTIGNITASDTSHNYTISGANVLTLDVTTGMPAVDVTQSARTLTIASVVAGIDGLQKNGPGTLILSGANTYTGNTTISSGTLQVGSGTTGSLSPTSAIVNNATLSFGRTNTITQGTDFASVITGTGGVTKLASGTLVLNGANTYTGVTQINASGRVLQVTLLANGGSASSIGASNNLAANLLLGNASVFRYAGTTNAATDRGFTINGTANGHGTTIESSGTGTLSFTNNPVGLAYGTADQTRTLTLGGTNTGNNTFGKVVTDNGTGAVTLAKSGAGRWILDHANSYTGITRLNANGGTLDVTMLADGGSASSIGASGNAATNLLLGRSTTLRYIGSADVTTNRSFTINGTAAGHGATINSSGSGTLSFNDHTIPLAYGTVNQTRSLTLRGTNTGNNTFGKIIANNVTAATSVTKADAGVWILDQANTYTGTTRVSAGTLRAGAAAGGQAFGVLSPVLLSNVAGAVLDLNGYDQTVGSLAGGGGAGGNVSLGSATLTTGGLGTNTSYSGVISGTGGLTKVGTGTQTINRTQTYTGPTLITAGTLQIGSTTAGALSASTAITNNATLAFSRTNTLVVSNAIAGTGSLVKLQTGTIRLTGSSTYTGTTTISAGTLQLGNAGTTGSLSPSSAITNNGTLAFSRTNTITQGTDFGSVIAGTGGVTKLASGTLVLNGSNTYGGGTTVAGGTLLANNVSGSATGTGAVAVSTGATFGGTGSITGALTINAGGTLAPGASIASLASGTLTFNNGSTFEYEVDSSAALGVAADLQVVTGNLVIANGVGNVVTLDLFDLAASPTTFAHNTTFALINYSGTWNGGLFTVDGNAIANGGTFSLGSTNWQLFYDATSGGVNFSGEYAPATKFVTMVALPEPPVVVLLAAGGLIGLVLARRRKAPANVERA